jgi:hypothetical protein
MLRSRRSLLGIGIFASILCIAFLCLLNWKYWNQGTQGQFYVYSIPEGLLYKEYNMRPETCPYRIYSSEIVVPELIKRHKHYYQPNPSKASFFVVPHFSTCFYHYCLESSNSTVDECKDRTQEYFTNILDWVDANFDHWENRGGIDHIFVFSWDQGSEILGSDSIISNRVSSSVHLVHHGKRGIVDQNYSPLKDLVIPVYRDFTTIDRLLKKHQAKTIFAYFRGTLLEHFEYGQGIRKLIKSLGKNKPEKYFVKEGHSEFYWHEIAHAVFSLCPPGWSLWSPRFYDALTAKSIPVLFGDEWILPFEDIIDYKSFVVYLKQASSSWHLDSALTFVSQTDINRKVEKMGVYVNFLRFNEIPQKGDAIDTILRRIMQSSKVLPIPSLERSEF